MIPKLSPAQVRWFRMKRSGLVSPFASPEDTAGKVLGVQAQLAPAAELAFWNRSKNCSREGLQDCRFEKRSLLRFWGQRNTVHMFRCEDWPLLHSAFALRQVPTHRKLEKVGLLKEFKRVVRRIRERLVAGEELTYKDVKSKKLSEEQDKWVVSYLVFMQLVREGVACTGPDRGNQTSFVHREHWLPDLEWSPPDEAEAHRELARRYLQGYGPAEVQDLAFWYGGKVGDARAWIASLGKDCHELSCSDRSLYCLAEDLEELRSKPPAASAWPIRLLNRFDPLLLACKDKSWLIDREQYKRVWLPSAHVAAVILVGGRIAGTWRYDRKGKELNIDLQPFGKLSSAVRKAIAAQTEAVSAFFAR